MRSAWIPLATRNSLMALARRSPKARLYSRVPRSSEWPSISSWSRGWPLRNATHLASSSRPSGLTEDLSVSKKTRSAIDCGQTCRTPSSSEFLSIPPLPMVAGGE